MKVDTKKDKRTVEELMIELKRLSYNTNELAWKTAQHVVAVRKIVKKLNKKIKEEKEGKKGQK